MSVISRVADRLLNTTAEDGTRAGEARPLPPGAVALHRDSPVVDLVVGSALFRQRFLGPVGHGHVDLPRLRAGGVNVIGLTVATRHPDLRGTLSRVHFRSLGIPPRLLSSDMAIAEWVIDRVTQWAARSGGGLRLVRDAADLAACLVPDGPVGIFVGVQGGHVLERDPANVARLHSLGVRMLAPAHVMDNELVGSGTGRTGGGLTGFGREVVAELEHAGIIVDLAHMSLAGIADSLPLLRRPFALSHTGFVELSGAGSRWRRYSPRTRNIPASVADDVASAGGVIGVILSTWLLGGESLDRAAAAFELAVRACGKQAVALGSDMDGGLRAVVDVAGLPRLTDLFLARGMDSDTVRAVVGGNAVRLLGTALA